MYKHSFSYTGIPAALYQKSGLQHIYNNKIYYLKGKGGALYEQGEEL